MSHYLKLRKSILNNYASTSNKYYLVHFDKPIVLFSIVLYCSIRGFIDIFSGRATGFHRQSKHFKHFFFYKKTFYLDVQTTQIKVSSQPVNLPGLNPKWNPSSMTLLTIDKSSDTNPLSIYLPQTTINLFQLLCYYKISCF